MLFSITMLVLKSFKNLGVFTALSGYWTIYVSQNSVLSFHVTKIYQIRILELVSLFRIL